MLTMNKKRGALPFPALLCTWMLWLPAMAGAQQTSAVRQIADATMRRWPDGKLAAGESEADRNAELGMLLVGMDAAWYGTADGSYYRYLKAAVDPLIDPDGSISPSGADGTSLNGLLLGRQLLLLYGVTQEKRYYEAAKRLRQELGENAAPTAHGRGMGFAGLYAAEPFYAAYAREFQEPQDFAGITQKFVRTDKRMQEIVRYADTVAFAHRGDSIRVAPRDTARMASFRVQGMGWLMMALVDTLPSYPQNAAGRAQLQAILERTAAEVVRYQDGTSGLWHQVPDEPAARGNDFDPPAACMLTYALAKGVRLGYLPQSYDENAERAWRGIETHFVKRTRAGGMTLTGTPSGSTNEQVHSYEHTVNLPVAAEDPAGVGLYLLAASELGMEPNATAGLGTKVTLDAWYNSQTRQNAAGQTESFHYKWSDYSNSGFSLLGHLFRIYGVATDMLDSAPTAEKLRQAQFYIIVSPDNPAKNPQPHYMTAQDAEQIAEWVRGGGMLLMMENDPANADIPHMDLLADKFGLHFNNVLVHHVIGDKHAMGRIVLPKAAPPFTQPHVLFMKDTCSLTLSGEAKPLLRDKSDLLMGMAWYGKGMVLAVTDPWLYNEYTDGRNLPPEYDNFDAGKELVRWLVKQRAQLAH